VVAGTGYKLGVLIDHDILREHADEAATLWSLRQVTAGRAHMHLSDLREQDERIEAHLDGLRLAGADGWQVATAAAAEAPGAGAVFVLAALACEVENPDVRRAAVAEALLADPGSVDGAVAGFTWVITPRTAATSDGWWQRTEAVLRQVALGIAVASVRDPGERLNAACGDADAALRGRALRAAGQLGRRDLRDRCRTALGDVDPACQGWAACSLALLDTEVANAVRTQANRAADALAAHLIDIAARRLPRATVMEWLNAEAKKPATLRRAVQMAGVHGDTLVMPWLLLQLQVPAVARYAGHQFSLITGIDLEESGLTAAPPAGFHAGPSDDPADPEVAPDVDEYLPWPDAAKVAAWWKQHEAEFPAGVRRLLGCPLGSDHLDVVLRSGTQPQRAAAAIEQIVLSPGRPLFDVLAPAERQVAALPATNVASSAP
jgi:uncharacterized protein (TIGR02270 family)